MPYLSDVSSHLSNRDTLCRTRVLPSGGAWVVTDETCTQACKEMH